MAVGPARMQVAVAAAGPADIQAGAVAEDSLALPMPVVASPVAVVLAADMPAEVVQVPGAVVEAAAIIELLPPEI